jgi:tRNA threonylcarbamoyladenosine biosynthesis protein TsaE
MSNDSFQLTLTSRNPEETIFIGRILGENLIAVDIVALIGDLGAGKTCLTQGIAKGLDVPDQFQIASPTFTLINEYKGRVALYHFDLYRINGSRDLEEMGCDEYFFGEGISIIEWAEKIKEILPHETIYISMTHIDENHRGIVISMDERRNNRILNALKDGGF